MCARQEREREAMEGVYLICSIVSTSLTSLTLSLLFLVRRLFSFTAGDADDNSSVSLYQGTVWHERRRPVHHSFNYAVRYALVDLDLSSLPDHLSSDQARSVAHTNGPVLLLTVPPSMGYQQNPLSIYYCYDMQDSATSLKKCIAEVTNTPWGERVSFLFDPNSDSVAKPLHVSPFMDMLGNWKMRTSTPGDSLFVAITVDHPNLGDYFTATLTAKRVSSTTDHALFFWLMPHKVAIWIYWQALKLWWKKVEFIQHPRYHTPAYKEEALLRDKNHQFCPVFTTKTNNNQFSDQGKNIPGLTSDQSSMDRWFVWRDAKWPWC